MMMVTTLDDIAWLMNLRGNDISYNPLFFSFLILHNKTDDAPFHVDLFISKSKVATPEVTAHLQANNVTVYEYGELVDKLKGYGGLNTKIVVDSDNLNYQIASALKENGFEQIPKENIVEAMKAVKNKVQMEGMRQSNIRDCAAIVKYFSFLEEELKKPEHGMNEFTGAMKLLEFRAAGELFKGPSFETISSIGPNGAIIHYSPTAEDNAKLNNDEIYLLDSGG